MTKRDNSPSIGALIGGLLAVLIGIWLVFRILKSIFWLIKIGLFLALGAAIFFGMKNLGKKK